MHIRKHEMQRLQFENILMWALGSVQGVTHSLTTESGRGWLQNIQDQFWLILIFKILINPKMTTSFINPLSICSCATNSLLPFMMNSLPLNRAFFGWGSSRNLFVIWKYFQLVELWNQWHMIISYRRAFQSDENKKLRYSDQAILIILTSYP